MSSATLLSTSEIPKYINEVVDVADSTSFQTPLGVTMSLQVDGTLWYKRNVEYTNTYDINGMSEQIKSIQERLDKMENLFNICFCR